MGFTERPILFLRFREQPHVLDGDHGLVGEGLEQSDLAVGERPRLRPPDTERAEEDAIAHHGYAECAAKADRADEVVLELAIKLDIGYMNNGAFENNPTRKARAARTSRDEAARGVEHRGCKVMCRN